MEKPYSTIRIIIADDHEMVRDGLRVMIGKIRELEIIGEALNGEQLVQLTRRLAPDVILTDVRMPGMSGLEAAKIIKKEFPHIGIVALSSYDEEDLIMDMMNAGAKGYLLKNASNRELTEAVKAVYRDDFYYCSQAKIKMAAGKAHLLNKNREENKFTDRELQVIRMICEEKTSKEIGSTLGLQSRTIERYRDAIMEKMEVKNLAGVVMYAIKNNLYDVSAEKK
jgi:Response regulator containing a CheY-like receiver domain and an HTH DNA-binding domain